MRLATFVTIAAATLMGGFAAAQTDNRYGGSSSSVDLSTVFDDLPRSSAAGGYRSQPAPPTTPTATAPAATATPAAPANDLRSPPASADSRVATPRANSGRTTSSVASPAARSLTPAATATAPRRDPFATTAGGSPSRSSSTTLTPPPRAFNRTTTPPRETPPAPPRSTYTRAQPSATSPAGRTGQPPQERSIATTADIGAREQTTQRMLQKMLRRHSSSRLSGTPMSLASVIADAPSREEQSRRVEAYWALMSSVADYYLGLYESAELRKLSNEVSTFSEALRGAQTVMATRVETSLKAARASQYRLARLMGTGVMPLPSETPFTGPYNTRLSQIFPTGAPSEARLLNDLLPLRLAELQNAADNLAQTEEWVELVRKRQNSGSNGEAVINALTLNSLSRRAFVQLARDYNLQINRYTQLVTPELVDTGRLVAMLIRTPTGQLRSGDSAFVAGVPSGSASANLDFRAGSAPRR